MQGTICSASMHRGPLLSPESKSQGRANAEPVVGKPTQEDGFAGSIGWTPPAARS